MESIIKNIHIRDFIVESAEQVLNINAIPEVPCSNVLIENGQINSKRLIGAINDVDGFTIRDVDITCSEDNQINILDSRNILFEDVNFMVPTGKVITNIKGEASKNIIYRQKEEKGRCAGRFGRICMRMTE